LRPIQLQPSGCTECSVSLTHCEAGGATTGRWSLVAWFPPGHPAAKLAPIVPQPWFPIRAFVNDRAAATPVPVAEVPEDLPPIPLVVHLGGAAGVRGPPPGSIIHQWGLFLASDLGARVLMASSGCPSGWGVRPLSCLELAALWDVPILVMNALSEDSFISILQGFCASAPAKVLFAGADALLTTFSEGVLFCLAPWFSHAARLLVLPSGPTRSWGWWSHHPCGRRTIAVSQPASSRATPKRRTELRFRTTCGSTLSWRGTPGRERSRTCSYI
jgi:hypothetical protein